MEEQQKPGKETSDRALRPDSNEGTDSYLYNPGIVEQAKRWIRFLAGRDIQLTRTASALYDRMVAAGPLPRELHAQGAAARADIVDRIEWTLAALENWIEAAKPPDDDAARLVIEWTDGDGRVAWAIGGLDKAAAKSLLDVVRAGASFEGQFSEEAARRIAAGVVADLRSGDLQLLRTRPLPGESTANASAFELEPRGAAYKEAIATADDGGLAMLEASLAEPEHARLAAIMDEAAYGALPADDADILADEIGPSDVDSAVSQVAEIARMSRFDAARCLLAVTNHRLDSAARSGDHASTLRLAKTISNLAACVAAESRK
jgi:hypothetical protein